MRAVKKHPLIKLLSALMNLFFSSAVKFFEFFVPAFFSAFSDEFSKYVEEKPEKDREEKERKKRDNLHVNWRGEYSGEDDINLY